MIITRTYLLVLFSLFLSMNFVHAQSAKQKVLEAERQQKLREIKQINALLFSNKKEQKSVITLIEDINYKISVRKNLIRITNEQANLLTREINSNQKEITSLRAQLQELKDDYAAMIVKSYNTAANGILVIASIFSGCAIIPDRNTLTLNKTIELDERAIEKIDVGIRLEWIR